MTTRANALRLVADRERVRANAARTYERFKSRADRIKALETTPLWVETWRRFDAAVALCRLIEKRHGFPVWAGNIPEDRWPSDYRAAVREWDEARMARDALYKNV